MKRGPTLVLLALAALLAVAAWLLLRPHNADQPQAGAMWLPDLAAKAESVAAVECLRGNATVRVERGADGAWVLASNEGYPVDAGLVKGLVVSLAALRADEPMTAKPERHAALGLAWPDTDARARRVRLLPADPGAAPVADIILGEERAPDFIFVRVFDQPQTWRARGRVQLPDNALAWLDRSLLTLPEGEAQRATLRGLTLARGASAGLDGPPPAWTPVAPPDAGWTPTQVQAAQLGLPSLARRLEFEGVRRARAGSAADPAYSPVFEARGATIGIAGHRESDGVWVQLTITPKPDATPPAGVNPNDSPIPDYAALAARVNGWEYRLPDWIAQTFDRMNAAGQPGAAAPPGVPHTDQPATPTTPSEPEK